MMGDGSGEARFRDYFAWHEGSSNLNGDSTNITDCTLQEATSQTFTPIEQRQRSFGPSWSTHWFKIIVTVPDELEALPAVFQWDMDSEGLVWSTDGIPLQGLTGGRKCDM